MSVVCWEKIAADAIVLNVSMELSINARSFWSGSLE